MPESLKNVLLVMQASGALLGEQMPDERPEEMKERWTLTQQKLESFLPGFLLDVIPPPPVAEPVAAVPATKEGPQ